MEKGVAQGVEEGTANNQIESQMNSALIRGESKARGGGNDGVVSAKQRRRKTKTTPLTFKHYCFY